jgi:uncharacterized repeat protein (TIGR02543 family)
VNDTNENSIRKLIFNSRSRAAGQTAPRFSTGKPPAVGKIEKPRYSTDMQKLIARQFRLALGLGLLFAVLLSACSLPFMARSATTPVNFASLAAGLKSRAITGFSALSIEITAADGSLAFSQTWDSIPSGAITANLEIQKDYKLKLSITNTEDPTLGPQTWVYERAFQIPETGDLPLDIHFVSLADFDAFGAAMDAIGNEFGWKDGSGPMQDAFANAGASSATAGSGATADGKYTWSWTKSGANTIVRVDCVADVTLGATSYTLKSGSCQTFSGQGDTTTVCKAVWNFSGGAIDSIEADYTGQGQNSVIITAKVNGFDFTQPFSQATKGGGNSGGDYHAFFTDDMPKLNLLFNSLYAGSTMEAVFDDMASRAYTGSGSGANGDFGWSWTGTGPANYSFTITCNLDTPLGGSSASVVEHGSLYRFTKSGTSTTQEFDYRLHGGTVNGYQKKAVGSPASYDIQVYTINGTDYLSTIVSVTLHGWDGSADFNHDAIMGSSFKVEVEPYRAGYTFAGWYRDAALTQPWIETDTVTGPTALWAKWAPLFAGGSGTSGDPFQIASAQQLYNIRKLMSTIGVFFKQSSDIDLAASLWAAGWIPLPGFQGSYNGQFHTIDNLVTMDSGGNGSGLFADPTNAEIKNLIIDNAKVSGSARVGILAGHAFYSTITACGVSGTATGTGSSTLKVGGLIGHMKNCTIEQCYSTATIKTTDSLSNSYGGLIGIVFGGSIRDCYATGSVVGNNAVGGLVGQVDAVDPVNISRSYASGWVGSVGSSFSIGGFTGNVVNSGNFSAVDNFWDQYNSGQNTTAGIVPTQVNTLPAADLCIPGTYPNWDFNPDPIAIWNIQSGSSYPYLTWQTTPLVDNLMPLVRYRMDDAPSPGTIISSGSKNSWEIVTFTGCAFAQTNHREGNSAVFLDGLSSMIVNNPTLGSAFTMSAWVCLSTSNSLQTIICNRDASQGLINGFSFATNAAGKLSFSVGDDSSQFALIDTGASLDTTGSVWYRVALTKDASGNLTLYRDGVQVASGNPGFSFTVATSFYLGRTPAVTEPLSGYLDDVRIYDRALTPAQVAALY